MKTNILAATILILVSMATKSEAFTFDVWESGMDADTIIMTAMKEDIPLFAEGKFAAGHFNKRACVPYRKTATKYIYHAELLGKKASVYLVLTEKDKRLMQITILWNNASKLEKVIRKIILNKKPISDRYKINLFAKTRVYKLDDENEVELKNEIGNIHLTYYNLKLIAQNTADKKRKKHKKLVKDVSKDWQKF